MSRPCTIEQVAAFNRALYEVLPQVCEESGVPATHVALYGIFVMSDGGVLSANLTPPLTPAGEQS